MSQCSRSILYAIKKWRCRRPGREATTHLHKILEVADAIHNLPGSGVYPGHLLPVFISHLQHSQRKKSASVQLEHYRSVQVVYKPENARHVQWKACALLAHWRAQAVQKLGHGVYFLACEPLGHYHSSLVLGSLLVLRREPRTEATTIVHNLQSLEHLHCSCCV